MQINAGIGLNLNANQQRGLMIWGGDPERHLKSMVLGVIDNILATDWDSLSPLTQNKLVTKWAAECDDLDSRITYAEGFIEQGRRFFTPENIAQTHLLGRPRDARIVKYTVWNYDTFEGERLSEGQYKRRLQKNRTRLGPSTSTKSHEPQLPWVSAR